MCRRTNGSSFASAFMSVILIWSGRGAVALTDVWQLAAADVTPLPAIALFGPAEVA
jgi:hypothetical protein